MFAAESQDGGHAACRHAADGRVLAIESTDLVEEGKNVVDLGDHLRDDVKDRVRTLQALLAALAVSGEVHGADIDASADQAQVAARVSLLVDGPPVHPEEEGARLAILAANQQRRDVADAGVRGDLAEAAWEGCESIGHGLRIIRVHGLSSRPMLRIISGEFGSRRLKTPPDGQATRPWSGLAREAVFNMLRGHLPGGTVLDLFAGVGTMGLEAASRGAQQVLLVERDRRVLSLLRENVADLGCEDRVEILGSDALASVALLRAASPLDVAFVDPPYALMEDEGGRSRVLAQMEQLAGALAPGALVFLRTPMDPALCDHCVPGLAGPEVHRYGHGMWVLIYAPTEGDAS